MKLTVVAILMAAAALGIALLLFSDGGFGQPRVLSDQREVFGATVTITIYDQNAKTASQAISDAFDRIAQIESIASSADEASEISQLNQESYLPAASDELVEMLRLAFVVNQVSDGAFDVSHGALLDLWRFDPEADAQFKDVAPDVQSASITAAKRHVRMDRILLGSGRKTSVSLVPGTRIVLDAIAMGYALDAAVNTLRDAGIEHALIDAGTVAYALGTKPNGLSWSFGQFQIADKAIASATDGMFILDPRTGYPATAASSATVIAPTAAEAQALATATLVMGSQAGLALIEQLARTEALIFGFERPVEAFRSSGLAAFESMSIK